MNDDMQTPIVISNLFDACHLINIILDHKAQISAADLEELAATMRLFAFDILGLKEADAGGSKEREEAFGKVVDMVLDLRAKAKELAAAGFEVNDTKDGSVWRLDK